MASLQERAQPGRILTVGPIHRQLCPRAGQEVSGGYLYGLLQRHHWRQLDPRPRPVQAHPQVQHEFKRNYGKPSNK